MTHNGDPADPPIESIIGQLEKAAVERPDDVALVDNNGQQLTYRAWLDRARKAAGGMGSVAPGTAVLLAFRNSEVLDFATAYIGLLGIGAVAVPVPMPTPRAEIDRIAKEAGAEHLVSSRAVETDLNWLSLPAMLESGVDRDLIAGFDPRASAQILFSSGTTGLPSAIVVPHGSLGWSRPPAKPERSTRSVLLHAFPVGTSAFQNQLIRSITHDYTVRVLSIFDPRKLLQILRGGEGVETILFAPAMVNLLSDLIGEAEQFPDVTSIGLTGSFPKPGHYHLLKRIFPAAEVITSYGSTESAPAGTSRHFDPDNPLNVGPPNKGCAVRITDESGSALPPGAHGTVWLSAQGAPTRRYLNDELTRRHFDGDWIRMGDLGYLEPDGSLVLVGRATEIISVGGLKVSVPEVEAVLSRHALVRDVSVFGIPHPVLGQQVAAEVVATEPDQAGLIAFARKMLGSHKVPAQIVFVDKIERNAMGKVSRRRATDGSR